MRSPLTLLSIIIVLASLSSALAQSPSGINYQGVARDLDGKPLVLRDIAIKTSILKNGDTGEVEYSEVHDVKTNSFGLFTLVIGSGNPISGDFRFISWAIGGKWLKVELDPDGGSAFHTMGAQQFMSVPYAFYSQYSGNGLTAGPGISIDNSVITNAGDTDATNEFNTDVSLGSDRKLKITDGGGTKEVDLSPLAVNQTLSGVLTLSNDAGAQKVTNLGAPTNATDAATKGYVDAHVDSDSDASNELQDIVRTGNTLHLTNNPASVGVNMASFMDNTDNQQLTLTGTSLAISSGNSVDLSGLAAGQQNLSTTSTGTSRTIDISGGTGVTIDVADNDNSITNEIQDLTLAGNALSLSGDATPVDLTPYVNTDNQNLSLGTVTGTNHAINIGGGAGVILDVADNDNSITNEIQDLTRVGNSLTLSGDATPVDLTPYVNTDSQNLSLGTVTGTNHAINIGGGTGVTLDVADNDNSITNEIQDLTRVGNSLSLTGDATPVDLTPYVNTDSQNLSLGTVTGTNHAINIGGGTGVTLDVADNDNSITNEIQDLSLAGNSLSITGDLSPVDLTPYVNTDNQNLSLGTVTGTNHAINIGGGTGVVLDVADNDNSITNEIQDLTLTGNTLSLSGDATTVNLAPYSQTLSYTGATRTLTISGSASSVVIPETQNLTQVLTQGTDAGAQNITNLAAPVNPNDASTKKYVDDADAILASKIATTYAFKAGFNFTNGTLLAVNDATIPFNSEAFDDFNVIGGTSFTANEAGTYVFIADGSYAALAAGAQLSFLVNGVKFPIALVQPWGGVSARFNSTLMFKLTAGQTVSLVGDNVLVGGQFIGSFFGYKL